MSNNNETSMPIMSELDKSKLKVGKHLFTADFGSDTDGKFGFNFSEFEILKVVNDHINKSILYYEICDVTKPKISMKESLECGFFESKKDAAKAFVNSINIIAEKSSAEYNKLFNKD